MQYSPVKCEHLVVFAKLPQAGVSKTRLIPALGADRAAEVYRVLARQTLDTARNFAADRGCRLFVYYTGGAEGDLKAEYGHDLEYVQQSGEDLGQRLRNACVTSFSHGASRLVIIGTDCPTLGAEDIAEAFEALSAHDVVLGPAQDGGYYLIGMRRCHVPLFEAIPWSSESVLQRTIAQAESLGLKHVRLRLLADVDYPEDLLSLRSGPQRTGESLFEQVPGRLSIVLPTLNEAESLPAVLATIGQPSHDLEVIVVDAGSTDATVRLAKEYGCHAFTGNRGRARQMNAGASVASGDNLLFLHADTLLPKNYRSQIHRVLSGPCLCGAFALKIDGRGLGLRLVEAGVALRCKLLRRPYGDQALFFRAVDFYGCGGFKPMAIMEDFEIVDRMRKKGRIGIVDSPVVTSSRRWKKKGILKTTLLNQLCIVAYRLGLPEATIERLYRGKS